MTGTWSAKTDNIVVPKCLSTRNRARASKELVETVQRHLLNISELTRAIAEAIAKQNENTAAELDKQVDLELGLKERAMGALHEHRREHGC